MITLTLRHGVRLVAATAIATACLTSCIDEDLTQCGKNYTIDYTVRQLTDVPAILQRHPCRAAAVRPVARTAQ